MGICLISAGFSGENPYESIDPIYKTTDVNSLIQIHDPNDILRKRDELIAFIWGRRGFPARTLPDQVEKNIHDKHFKELYRTSLARIDKLTINMANNMSSIAYHFFPKQSNGKLMIYHEGHSGDFTLGTDTIRFFLDHQYAVLAFSMPLKGRNVKPVVHLERFGNVRFYLHNQLKLLSDPYSYFFEPIAVSLNYVETCRYSEIDMIGFSGGGWTTVLYAAIDPRIKNSFPVAGSLPLFLRSLEDIGDWEQNDPELYQIATYPELYICGAYGKDRRQIQIFNQYDPCCFYGLRYQLYKQPVQDRIKSLGQGKFDAFLDTTNREHKVSETALQIILRELE